MIKLKEMLETNNKMFGVFHKKDLDGICSGAILKYKYPNIILIPFDYGMPIPKLIEDNSKVIMIDVSMGMKDMALISQKTNGNFTWIDHHISSYNAYKAEKEFDMEVVYDDKIAACEVAWKYFFPNKSVPLGVKLLSKYDIWDNKDLEYWDNTVMPFQYGMRNYGSINKFPMNIFKNDDETQRIIDEGNVILDKVHTENARILQNMFTMNLLGYRAICVQLRPGDRFQSNLFTRVYDSKKHDIMVSFAKLRNGNWKFHFRAAKDTTDCAKVANWFDPGGGGHKLAAGAELTDINRFIRLIPKDQLDKIDIPTEI